MATAFSVMHEDDPADIAGLLRVDRIIHERGVHEPHEIWARTNHDIPVASAQQANVMADIRVGFTGGLADTLRQVIQILSGSAAPR